MPWMNPDPPCLRVRASSQLAQTLNYVPLRSGILKASATKTLMSVMDESSKCKLRVLSLGGGADDGGDVCGSWPYREMKAYAASFFALTLVKRRLRST